ncbi:MAG: hypothetical protein A2Z77_01570 [Chloroflexi bacterium RBG_13_51_36]|nr:MAG: hypothetical protein A2Z77_01570 [Chloroflexi bacterium RBG_13_51_36]
MERHREYFCRAEQRAYAKFIPVSVEAPAEVVRQRLLAREETPAPDDGSDARWQVHNKMKLWREKISRNHLVIDTRQHITAMIDKIVHAITR